MQQFDPPFDSPIEESFAWHCTKYLRDDVAFEKQVECQTAFGLFRLDFAISSPQCRIGIECDGAAFHQDSERDRLRDAVVIGEGHVEAVFRFRGSDIHSRIEDVIYVLALNNRSFFTARGWDDIRHLASLDAREQVTRGEWDCEVVYCDASRKKKRWVDLQVTVRARSQKYPGQSRWMDAYEFTQTSPGGSLEDVVKRYIQSEYEGMP